jgi:hypothetical protein
MKRRHVPRTVDSSDLEFVAASEVPRLIAAQPMPGRNLAVGQQKINDREGVTVVCPRGNDRLRTAKDLAIIAAFGMRYESEFANQLFGVRVHGFSLLEESRCGKRRRVVSKVFELKAVSAWRDLPRPYAVCASVTPRSMGGRVFNIP